MAKPTKKAPVSKKPAVRAARKDDGSKSFAFRVWPQQIDLFTKAAATQGIAVTAFVRDAAVLTACEHLNVEAPALPEFRGRVSAVRQAAEKAGMSIADYRKAALARAVAADLGGE